MVLYENTRRRKEHREKKHKTGERVEWKLDATTPTREKAEENIADHSHSMPTSVCSDPGHELLLEGQ